MWWYVVSFFFFWYSFFQICYIKVYTDPLVDNSSSVKSVALAELEFKSSRHLTNKLSLFNYYHLRELYKEKEELTHTKHMQEYHIPIGVCAVVFLCLFLSSHSYQLKSPPSPFQLNILHCKHEFIFVSQTFLGWGLLGNGCMKDVSRARRDVWLWKRDKNSQKPKIGFLFHKMLMIKELILLIFRYLLNSFTVTVVWFHLSLSPFCNFSVKMWEWDELLQRVQQVIWLLYV